MTYTHATHTLHALSTRAHYTCTRDMCTLYTYACTHKIKKPTNKKVFLKWKQKTLNNTSKWSWYINLINPKSTAAKYRQHKKYCTSTAFQFSKIPANTRLQNKFIYTVYQNLDVFIYGHVHYKFKIYSCGKNKINMCQTPARGRTLKADAICNKGNDSNEIKQWEQRKADTTF